MFCFAVIDSLAITVIDEIHVSQLLFVRYWLFTGLALIYAHRRLGIRRTLVTPIRGLQVTRSLLAVAEVGLFLVSLKFLTLAESHALFATFPFWTLVLAALFLRETLRRVDLFGVGLGLIGTLIILRPGSGVFAIEALIPLSAAIVSALYHIVTRRVSQVDHYATTLLYTALIGAAGCTLVGTFYWVDATASQWLVIVLMGCIGVAAQLFLIAALSVSPASQLQPFNYSLLLFATLLGYLVFNQVPDAATILGAACIASAGIFVLVTRARQTV